MPRSGKSEGVGIVMCEQMRLGKPTLDVVGGAKRRWTRSCCGQEVYLRQTNPEDVVSGVGNCYSRGVRVAEV